MFTELKLFMSEAAPHLLDSLTECFKTFEILELPNYQDNYIELLMLIDVTDASILVDEIMLLTIEFQKFLLNSYGIELSNDTDIITKTIFLNAIVDIHNYSDTILLLETTQLPLNTNEVFAELVSLVTHKNTTELLLSIEKISPAFIYALKEHCEEIPEIITNTDREIKQKYIDAYITFIGIIKNDDLIITKLLNEGLDVGYPFSLYVSIIGKDLEAMPIKKAANELVACALVSSDGTNNPMGIIQDTLDTYFSSIDQITKISIEVTDLLLKIQRN